MFAAAVPETGYRIVFLLHIAAAVVAFASAFVHPRLGALAKRLPGDASSALRQNMVDGSTKIHFPALVLTGLLGSALIPMSEFSGVQLFEFSQTWVSISYLVWFAMMGVFFFLLVPAERALVTNPADTEAQKRFGMFGGIIHLLLLVMLYLMIFKPGL